MTDEQIARMVAEARRLDNRMAAIGAFIATLGLGAFALPALAAVLQGVTP